jgi:hypothetical protein
MTDFDDEYWNKNFKDTLGALPSIHVPEKRWDVTKIEKIKKTSEALDRLLGI